MGCWGRRAEEESRVGEGVEVRWTVRERGGGQSEIGRGREKREVSESEIEGERERIILLL